MRVAIADDSALFREGLRLLLETVGVEVVFQARTPAQFLRKLDSIECDVAIIDMRMPPTHAEEGLELAQEIWQRHELPALILSAHITLSHARRLLQFSRGGVGILSKDTVANTTALRRTLQRLSEGETVLEGDIAVQLIQDAKANLSALLSRREVAVLESMAEGQSNAGISNSLGLSPGTVAATITSIFRKLEISQEPIYNRRVLAIREWLQFDT